MILFVTILHVLLCLALVLVILLQPAKDGSQLLGGGVNSMYGPRGNAHPLGRATTVIAGLFMVTSIILAYESTQQKGDDADQQDEIKKLEEEKARREAETKSAEPEPAPAVEVPATEVPAAEVPAAEVPAAEVPAAEAPATGDPATGKSGAP